MGYTFILNLNPYGYYSLAERLTRLARGFLLLIDGVKRADYNGTRKTYRREGVCSFRYKYIPSPWTKVKGLVETNAVA